MVWSAEKYALVDISTSFGGSCGYVEVMLLFEEWFARSIRSGLQWLGKFVLPILGGV